MDLNLLEWIWWWINGSVPERYGRRVRVGKYYDRYFDPITNKKWLFDKQKGKMLDD